MKAELLPQEVLQALEKGYKNRIRIILQLTPPVFYWANANPRATSHNELLGELNLKEDDANLRGGYLSRPLASVNISEPTVALLTPPTDEEVILIATTGKIVAL